MMRSDARCRAMYAAMSALLLAPATAYGQIASASGEDIIVTALKREQSIQDVSATIDTFNAGDLAAAGITTTQDLEFAVPGLQFGNGGIDGARISLRGISSVRAYTGDDSAVAAHINGVFLPYSGLALGSLFDVERIEVLKGPQGTLYGRNATAGAINIITQRPERDFGGFAEVSYGSFETVRANAAINLPLGDAHAIRIAGTFANGDGYITNILDDRTFANEDRWGARISYRGEFGGVVADIVGEYLRDDGQLTFGGVVPVSRAPGAVGIAGRRDFFDTIVDAEDTSERRETVYLSATLTVPVTDAIDLRSITGYTDYDLRFAGDAANLYDPTAIGAPASATFGQAYATQDGYSLSQELNLIGSVGDLVDFVVGGFYVRQKVTETRFSDNRGAPPTAAIGNLDDFLLRQSGDAVGIFADVTVNATDDLRVIGGIRYNWERKTQSQDQTSFFPGFGLTDPLNFADTLRVTYEKPSFRAGLEYDVTDENLLYFTYGRGFRSGAIGGIIGIDNFFDVAFGGPGELGLVKLEPEIADAFEFGSKNSFLDGRVTVNLATFYTIYRDQLFLQFDPFTFQQVEGNIGRSRTWGVDFSVSAQVTDRLRISVAGEYLNTRVTGIVDTAQALGVAEGNELPYAPPLSFVIGADYVVPFSDSGELSFGADYSFKGDHFFNLSNTAGQREVGLLNANIRFDATAGWYVFATARNITDKEYFVSGGIDSRVPDTLQTGRPGTPRQIFGGVGFRF